MGNEWTKIKLKELGTIVTGKTPSSKTNEPFSSQGVLFVTPRDMKGQRWIIQTERYLSDEGLKAVKNSFIPKGSIAVSCIGSDMGKANIIKADSVTNQQINSIIVDKSKHDPLFIYYSLSLKQEYFKSIASGSATPILNKNDFGECEIDVPSKESQVIISSFLDVLDTKIEINNKINQTLEQMSQTLFKSWFVDFDPVIDNALDAGNSIPETLQSRAELRQKVRNSADFKPLPADIRSLFPAEFEETELGWIPKSWEIGKLQDLLILQRGFDLPSTQRNIGLHPIIAASGYNGTHDIAMVKAPGIVTGRSGVLGNVFLILEDFWPLNTTLWVKELKRATPCYGYELLKMIDFSSFNGGSAVPTLNRNHIHNLDYLLPPRNLIEKFELFSMSLHRRVHKFQKQKQILTALRDTLLPKLISGELSLEDLPNLVAQTEPA